MTITTLIGVKRFIRLKGEFGAEGLARQGVVAEALFAASNALDYLVNIIRCEARTGARRGFSTPSCPRIRAHAADRQRLADGVGQVGLAR